MNLLDFIRGLVRPTVCWLLVATCVFLAIVGHPIPEFLMGLTSTSVGFYFATRGSTPPPPVEAQLDAYVTRRTRADA